jgi:hypothetical protein
MTRKPHESPVFTDDDKKFLTFANFAREEIEERQQALKASYVKFGVISNVCILLFSGLLFLAGSDYFGALTVLLLLFLDLMLFCIYRCRKGEIEVRNFYYRIEILERLPEETEANDQINGGSAIDHFYPVRGRDVNSGYESIFYIDEADYKSKSPIINVPVSGKFAKEVIEEAAGCIEK